MVSKVENASRYSLALLSFFLVLLPHSLLGDQLLVAGFFSDSVGKYDALTGQFLGNYQSGAGLNGALAARIGPDGLLYVASETSNQVLRYNVNTCEFIDVFVAAGSGGLDGPSAVTWDPAGDLYVASFNSDSILKFDGATGTYLGTPVTAGSGGVNGPDNGTIFGPDGKLYVPSYYSNQVICYDLKSQTSEVFINGIGNPRVLVFLNDQLYITSESTDAVRRYSLDGTFIDNFIQPGSAILDVPVGLAFHNNHWFVSSVSMDKVLQFDTTGTLVNADFIPAGSGGLDAPVFITAVSTEAEFPADDFSVFRGLQIGGDLSDTFGSDDAYLKFNPGVTINSSEPPVWIVFQGTLPSGNPASLVVTLEASASTVGLTQTIELFNWTTGQYQQVDAQAASHNIDTVVTVDVSANIADFVQGGTGIIKTRTGWRATGPVLNFPWTVCIDQVVWAITQ